MKRLRSYEFALIGSLVAMLPLGITCVLTFPLGLWSLLVLLRPNVRAAFRTPSRARPLAWQNQDAELLLEQPPTAALYQQARERVEARCRSAGMNLLIMAAFDVVPCIALLFALLTHSSGTPTFAFVALVCIPLLISAVVAWGGVCLLRRQNWGIAFTAAILTIAPLTPLWFLRWIVGLFVLIQLLRRDVRLAFERPLQSTPFEHLGKATLPAPPVYAPPSGISGRHEDE
jgi:hypothetical protein